MVPSTRRQLLTAGAASAAAALAGCSLGGTETDRTTRTVPLPSGARLAVRNLNGDVTAESGPVDEVEATVTKRTRGDGALLDRARVVGRRDDDTVHLETEYDGEAARRQVAVDLDVTLPEAVPLERAETTNGEVRASGVRGDARLQTTNGDVRADGVDGFVWLRSSNGDVTVRDCAGVDDASTDNGDVAVDLPALRFGGVRLATTNGTVEAALARDLDVELDCRTGNGEVTVTDLDLTDVSRGRGTLTGRLGGGDDELVVRTGNGAIRLSEL